VIKTEKIMVPIHERGILSDKEIKMSTQCLNCKHLTEPITCKAFPKGILSNILNGKIKHDHKLAGQTGDYIFEEKK